MNIYIIIAAIVLTLLGCKAFEAYEDNQKIKKEVDQMIHFPNLTNNLKTDNLKE